MTASDDRSGYFYENAKWRLLFSLAWIGLLAVGLLALLRFGGAAESHFFTGANFRFLTDQFLVIALLVPAMVMIVGAGGLDLSVGAVMGLTGLVFCAAANRDPEERADRVSAVAVVVEGGGCARIQARRDDTCPPHLLAGTRNVGGDRVGPIARVRVLADVRNLAFHGVLAPVGFLVGDRAGGGRQVGWRMDVGDRHPRRGQRDRLLLLADRLYADR